MLGGMLPQAGQDFDVGRASQGAHSLSKGTARGEFWKQ